MWYYIVKSIILTARRNDMSSFNEYTAQFFNYFINQIRSITFIDIIDILFVAVIFYYAYLFIKERRAGRLAIGVVLLIVLQLLSNIFNMITLNFLLGNLLQVGIIALIIVFQPELRSVLEKFADGIKLKDINIKFKDTGSKSDERVISDLVRAVCDLSKERTGALVVIERSTKLGDIIKTGTLVNSDMEPSLLKNIFFDKAPLHDGAVVIRDGRIHAAGCFLPLTSNNGLDKTLGTRHRAAIGMSEASDAAVIVVSEETGTISVAQNGVLKRNYDYTTLEKELRELIDNPKHGKGSADKSKDKKDKVKNAVAKVVSLLFAFVIWFYASGFDTSTYTKDFSQIDIDIRNESEFSILSGSGATIDISVEGSKNIINNISADDINAYVSIKDIAQAGRYSFDIVIETPDGVSVSAKTYDKLTVYLDNTTSVSVPVKLDLIDYMIDDGYELGETDAEYNYESITVTGPENVLNNIEAAQLTVALGHVTNSVTCKGTLELIDKDGNAVNNPYVKMQTSEISVYIPLYKSKSVPLSVGYKHGYYNEKNSSVEITPKEITVKGEPNEIDAIEYISLSDIDEKNIYKDGQYTMKINVPSNVENVDGITSATVNIKHIDTTTRDMVLKNITVKNPKGLRYELAANELKVTLRGPSSYLPYISAATIGANVDLSDISNSSGTVIVPVDIEINRVYSSNVYELGSYSITVKIIGE